MAGGNKPQLDRLIWEVDKLLPIWAKLETQNKNDCKILIEHKIGMLQQCTRPVDDISYKFLDTVTKLKDRVTAAGFNPQSVNAVVDKEMQDLMLKNGLESSAKELILHPGAPRFGVKFYSTDNLGDILEKGLGPYFLTYDEGRHGDHASEYLLAKSQGRDMVDLGVGFSGDNFVTFHHARSYNKIVLTDQQQQPLYVGMSSNEQAEALIAHFKAHTNMQSEVTDSGYIDLLFP